MVTSSKGPEHPLPVDNGQEALQRRTQPLDLQDAAAALACACKKQYSIRDGTIFEALHVPLLAWFRLITAVLSNPHVATHQLSTAIDISRLATVRRMCANVEDALRSPDAERRLAGLRGYVLRSLHKVSSQDANSSQRTAAAAEAV